MQEIGVSIMSPEAAENGVAGLWAADEPIGYAVLGDSEPMLRIEPRRDRTAVVVGARSLARALNRAEHLLEPYLRAVALSHGEPPAHLTHRANRPTLGKIRHVSRIAYWALLIFAPATILAGLMVFTIPALIIFTLGGICMVMFEAVRLVVLNAPRYGVSNRSTRTRAWAKRQWSPERCPRRLRPVCSAGHSWCDAPELSTS